MTYLTVPHSLVTGNTIVAKDWNENFYALEDGLFNAANDISVASITAASITASASITVSGNVSMGDISGQRMLLQVYAPADSSPDDTTLNTGGHRALCDDSHSNQYYGLPAPASGYIVGYSVHMNRTSAGTAFTQYYWLGINGYSSTLNFSQVVCNGNAHNVSYKALTWGVYPFANGDSIGIYASYPVGFTGAVYGGTKTVLLEVQFEV